MSARRLLFQKFLSSKVIMNGVYLSTNGLSTVTLNEVLRLVMFSLWLSEGKRNILDLPVPSVDKSGRLVQLYSLELAAV
jgi:hypothetical protein